MQFQKRAVVLEKLPWKVLQCFPQDQNENSVISLRTLNLPTRKQAVGLVVVIINHLAPNYVYRVSRGECARLRENVPYVKVHRYNPKHLHPKLNGYGDNGQRSLKV